MPEGEDVALLKATLGRQQACIDEFVARLEQCRAERTDLLQRTFEAEEGRAHALRAAAQWGTIVMCHVTPRRRVPAVLPMGYR